MKNLNSVIATLSLLLLCAQAFGRVQVNFDYKTFLTPENGVYLETHLNFIGGTMTYVTNENGEFQAEIEALIMIKKNSEIIDFEKILLKSPESSDSIFVDFLDLRRFTLEPGDYDLEIEIIDLNESTDVEKELIRHSEKITIRGYDEMSVSDIIYLSAWNKTSEQNDLSRSGYDMLPRVSDFFDSSSSKIGFYSELYHTDKFFGENELFALAIFVENSGGQPIKSTMSIKPLKTGSITPLFNTLDISGLLEGSYNLVIEIRNKTNEPQASRRIGFLRTSSYEYAYADENLESLFSPDLDDPDTLLYHIESLYPKADKTERRTILHFANSNSDLETLKSFFVDFWLNRNPANPKKAWKDYKLLIAAVDEEFGGNRVKEGYETDRGRVYIEYGPPNTRVVRESDPGCRPYEIWHYYKIENQINKRFVFVDSELSLNDYDLITSDKIGEITNVNWIDAIVVPVFAAPSVTDGNDPFKREDYIGKPEEGVRAVLQDLYLNPR